VCSLGVGLDLPELVEHWRRKEGHADELLIELDERGQLHHLAGPAFLEVYRSLAQHGLVALEHKFHLL